MSLIEKTAAELLTLQTEGKVSAREIADAFLAARERDPRLHLALAGGGPEEDVLSERLGEHATFLGWLAGDDLARAYASADVFLFASRTDTFGQVLLEAQASGLPAVAVAEGGPRELIEDGVTGTLFPAGDPAALADALDRLFANRARWDERRDRARRFVERDRNWSSNISRYMPAYQRLTGKTL